MTDITGYRVLSDTDIVAINALKKAAEGLLSEIEFYAALATDPESKRWFAIAKTQLQQASMAAVRAVALPTGV